MIIQLNLKKNNSSVIVSVYFDMMVFAFLKAQNPVHAHILYGYP